jgi:hypothetical protein
MIEALWILANGALALAVLAALRGNGAARPAAAQVPASSRGPVRERAPERR